MSDFKIVLKRYNYLEDKTKNVIQNEVLREFGHLLILKKYTWSDPDLTVLLTNEKKEVLAFYNIILRVCLFDEEPVVVGGINNLISPIKYRGKGYGKILMNGLKSLLFDSLNVKNGLLLCADEMIPFYINFDWYKVNSKLWFDQPDGKKVWKSNIMLLSQNSFQMHPENIDLRGLPW